MPDEFDPSGLQEQIDYLSAQVTSLKKNAWRINTISGSVVMNTGSATTLHAAITSSQQTSISLTSGTAALNGYLLLVGSEVMQIVSGGGTGTVVVSRGQIGTVPTIHANGTLVIIGIPNFAVASPNSNFILIPHNLRHIPRYVVMDSNVVFSADAIGHSHGIYESPDPTYGNLAYSVYSYASCNGAGGSGSGSGTGIISFISNGAGGMQCFCYSDNNYVYLFFDAFGGGLAQTLYYTIQIIG